MTDDPNRIPAAGPVAYAKLVDIARMEPDRLIRERLTQSAQDHAHDISHLMREVYIRGLRDGFQQGVQAMSEGGAHA